MTVRHRVLQLISARPDLTEVQIAELLFGGGACQQRVNPICRRLVQEFKIERLGSGGPGDPYRYRSRRITRAN